MKAGKSFRVAFCGLMAALALVLMFLTGIVPVGTYAFPIFAGALLASIVVEFGVKWAVAAYAVVSLLALFLAADKEAVVYFIAFFGFYPILKSLIERIRSRTVQYVVKYAVFTVCIVGAFLVCKWVLMIPDEEFTFFGVYIPWLFLIVAEVFFIFYDYCVTVLIMNYIMKIRNRIFKNQS